MLETNQRGQNAAQAVSGCDDVRVRVHLQYFFVKLHSRLVISVWFPHFVSHTFVIACVGASHAVTTLFPPVRAALTTATGTKQIVVVLVVTRSSVTFEHGHCGTLHG